MDLRILVFENLTLWTSQGCQNQTKANKVIFLVKLSYRDHLELEFQILIFGNVHPFPNTIYEIWKYSSNCQYLEI